MDSGQEDRFSTWTASLATELADDLYLFVQHASPATEEMLGELFAGSYQLYSIFRINNGLQACFEELACLTETDLTKERLDSLESRARATMGEAAYLVVQKHEAWARSLPPLPWDLSRQACLDPRRWRELDEETRITLSFWLNPIGRDRVALAMRSWLKAPREVVQRLLSVSTGTLDTLISRALGRCRKIHDALEHLSSPPFPAVLADALDGTMRPAVPEIDKQRALTSALHWLRTELRIDGGIV
jgi:hypothetical protein